MNDGEKEEGVIYTRSVGVKASNASSLSNAAAITGNPSPSDTAAKDTDPETGFPIIKGAVCPF